MIESIAQIVNSISTLEWVSVAFGLAYVILAARQNIACWPAALVGTGTAIFLFWDVSLVMESALNVYYLAMALFGWWQWRHGGNNGTELKVRSWQAKHHLSAAGLIALLTIVSGSLLSANTEAALPFLDSFTTWSAVLTTWMVAKKILENWLYWIVIDIASVYLYLERGLVLYALLFIVYTVVAVYGYRQWRASIDHA